MAESKIVYCNECGEYLGDIINGVLYKFGSIVNQPHVCGKPKYRSHILTDEEHEQAQEEFREMGCNY